jgi:glycosyltransferase involved in cell wall biosynthesis
MNAPLLRFSVVIAVRNAVHVFQGCLDSVFEQERASVEIVVMDGASTDGTLKLLERNGMRLAYWESQPDRGISHAWNKALDHVTGDWVIFLGADDRLASPDALARAARAISDDGAAHDVAYGAVRATDSRDGASQVVGDPWPTSADAFRAGRMIPHQGTFHARRLFERVGRFDESFRICADYELLLRELRDHDALFIPDLVVTDMGAGGLSARPETFPEVLRELYRARHMHGLADVPAWRAWDLQRSLIHARLRFHFGLGIADRAGDAYRLVTRRPRRGAP